MVDPGTGESMEEDLFSLTDGRESYLYGINRDMLYIYGPLEGDNKKGWPILLTDIKKTANLEGYSLVSNGGHKTTHCLHCCWGILV